jgi:mannose-6-phosphate isomerase
MLYPLIFHPIFKERVWGGRELERLYGKALPPGTPVGESWEITDRPEGLSVIANGPLRGKTLRWLMENRRDELLGDAKPCSGRFPLLVKLLDAREQLSLQVHPPTSKAAALGGEPKTEMWYVADAAPDAEIFVGLRRGVTRAEFERRIQDGTVADCFHRHRVKRGDAMFLPSGRVHALGGGCVLFEIQQNSDTTYRVFDWNRAGLDGKPRELHVAQALESIDFNDFEPPLLDTGGRGTSTGSFVQLVKHHLFDVLLVCLTAGAGRLVEALGLHVLAVVEGRLEVGFKKDVVRMKPGDFCVVPACCSSVELKAERNCTYLLARPK